MEAIQDDTADFTGDDLSFIDDDLNDWAMTPFSRTGEPVYDANDVEWFFDPRIVPQSTQESARIASKDEVIRDLQKFLFKGDMRDEGLVPSEHALTGKKRATIIYSRYWFPSGTEHFQTALNDALQYARRHHAAGSEVVWLNWPRDFTPPFGKIQSQIDREEKDEAIQRKLDREAAQGIFPQLEIVTNEDSSAVAEVDENGKSKGKPPLPIGRLYANLAEQTRGFPFLCSGQLMAVEHGIVKVLSNKDAFFAWLAAIFKCLIDWKSPAGGYVTQAQFYEHVRRVAPRYVGIASIPHEPPLKDHFYVCPLPPPGRAYSRSRGDGKTLNRLLDFFRPLTPIDRELIKAAFASVIWGGPAGAKPAILFSAPGRGMGKTTLSQALAAFGGGAFEVVPGENIEQLKHRLLTDEATPKQIVSLDNIKTQGKGWSWPEFESLVTAPTISGKKLYIGEACRANTFLWLITLNGPILSTDIAQRVVEVRLGEPKRRAGWHEELRRFIAENRQQIIADIVSLLRSPKKTLKTVSRWATWESEVLSRCENPDECMRIIARRQAESDVEDEEGDLLQRYFEDRLLQLTYDPDKDIVFIPSRLTALWVQEALREPSSIVGANRRLNQILKERQMGQILIPWKLDRNQRGYKWHGPDASIETPMRHDLEERIATLQRLRIVKGDSRDR